MPPHLDTSKLRVIGCWMLALYWGLGSRTAAGGPELLPHPGGLGFYGPTDPEVTAIFWNPAALGELAGTHFHLAGSPLWLSEQMRREGSPQATQNLDVIPDYFLGVTTDFAFLNFESLRFGIAYHAPFHEKGSIGPGDA